MSDTPKFGIVGTVPKHMPGSPESIAEMRQQAFEAGRAAATKEDREFFDKWLSSPPKRRVYRIVNGRLQVNDK